MDSRYLVRDLETIPMTRGQLVALLMRVFMAEGMEYAQAEIHARMHVDMAFIQTNAGAA